MAAKWPDFKFPPLNLWNVWPWYERWYKMSDSASEQWYQEVYLKQQEQQMEHSTWKDVKEDIDKREAMGAKKYGKYLTVDTSEDMLQHAYEEALDLVVYLKTLINQRKK